MSSDRMKQICLWMTIYIYIYIYRERECVCVCVYMHLIANLIWSLRNITNKEGGFHFELENKFLFEIYDITIFL